MKRSVIWAVALTLSLCGCDEGTSSVVRHPEARQFSGTHSIADRLPPPGTSARARLEELKRRIEGAELQAEIGGPLMDDSFNDPVFGSVIGAAQNEHGQLLVLDGRSAVGHVFHQPAGLHAHFGDSGPHRLQEPAGMALLDTTVVVPDRGRVLKTFVSSAGGLRFSHSQPVPWSVARIASCGSEVLVNAWTDDGWKWLVLAGSEVLSSLSPAYHAGPMAQRQLNSGPSACARGGEVIITAHEYFPWLTAFDRNGRLKWTISIAGFKQMSIVERRSRDGQTLSLSLDALGGYEKIESIVPVAPDVLLVQTVRKHAVPDSIQRDLLPGQVYEQRQDVRSFLLLADTGGGTAIGRTLPLIHAATDRVLWAVQRQPYWRVVSLRY